eukprot:CAMPEP_0183305884 /NCGR_PEP_ID=MMETSP0160_2-20130417/10485_1 /TAXON_ID=2839 ORGANISM="Odontella Sinensis, Strain Grunow 1884" /NCGR_SAMPLE_ID=MMETSP0160_2 /ASSEMBLY_ACC=CAM_ASM_000250 /LENGTH=95 /DNA_ID=CAMNT_0025469161 /DNA_START=169 /DNA_END=452 /DNA_ORIENTATION=-
MIPLPKGFQEGILLSGNNASKGQASPVPILGRQRRLLRLSGIVAVAAVPDEAADHPVPLVHAELSHGVLAELLHPLCRPVQHGTEQEHRHGQARG